MLRARSLLAVACVVLLAVAGCTAPSQTTEDSEPVQADPAGNATVAPGTTAHLAILNETIEDAPDEVALTVTEAADLQVDAPGTLTANATGSFAGWIGFTVPQDTEPGLHEVHVAVEVDDETVRTLAFGIEVTEPEETLSEGSIARVNLTARTAEGALAFTTQQAVDRSALPKAEGYQAPSSFSPIPLQVSDQSRLPPALTGALMNASIDQTVTVEVPEAFGPETIESQEQREETVERRIEQPRFTDLPRQAATQQGFINASSQEGDRVSVPTSPFPYAIAQLNETSVRIELAADEGDTFTLYPAWPDAASVVNVTNETVEVYVTPPVDEGETFTWNPNWPDATEIVEMDDETITLRHTPEVGSTYTTTSGRGQQAQVTVTEVGPDAITISQANPNPLGGQTLYFEMTVLDQQQPQQRRMAPPSSQR